MENAMSQSNTLTRQGTASTANVDMKLEVVVIPVADVDRAKQFYSDIGWRLDADFVVGDAFRGIQFTPPGSPCSVHFGKGIGSATPGSARGLYLVVSDIEAARRELEMRGAKVGDTFHRNGPGTPAVSGLHPQRGSYLSYATFVDPDGNEWMLQEVTSRFPGRVDPGTTSFRSASDLASAMRRASVAHGEYEKQSGGHDETWPDWYARYMVSEQEGGPMPS